jgi:hypothetical protein
VIGICPEVTCADGHAVLVSFGKDARKEAGRKVASGVRKQ